VIFGWLKGSKPAAPAPSSDVSPVAWAAQLYDVAIWRSPISNPGWHDWSIWQNLMQPIGAVLDHAEGPTSLHSRQSEKGKSAWLPFGRMIWNDANNRKWCTRYLGEASTVFYVTEVWAPGRKQALTGGQGPKVFAHLENFARSGMDSQTLTLAVRCSGGDNGFDQACAAISAVLTSAEFKGARRPWAAAVHKFGYTNGLNDAFGHFLFDDLTSIEKPADSLIT
jgi:hypothetical protein